MYELEERSLLRRVYSQVLLKMNDAALGSYGMATLRRS